MVATIGLLGFSHAAQVQFTDCLTTTNPNAQHFRPYGIDATFGQDSDDYLLSFAIYGNLTSGPPILDINPYPSGGKYSTFAYL
jgi:hypothetical protein